MNENIVAILFSSFFTHFKSNWKMKVFKSNNCTFKIMRNIAYMLPNTSSTNKKMNCKNASAYFMLFFNKQKKTIVVQKKKC